MPSRVVHPKTGSPPGAWDPYKPANATPERELILPVAK